MREATFAHCREMYSEYERENERECERGIEGEKERERVGGERVCKRVREEQNM